MSKQTCTACGGAIDDGFCVDCGAPAQKLNIVPAAAAVVASSTLPTTFTSTFATGTFGTSALGKATTRRTTRSTSAGSSARRNALGGGLISLPPQPSLDPLKMVMANTEVPERKRRCSKEGCGEKLSKLKGFCPKCGTPYNYIPSLKAGDIVNKKFEVMGAIAFGGLGWIYLAKDIILNRWVVLKGLLNAKDDAAAAAAVAERQFLAAVKHPKIVGIYDFIQHGTEGYIVMEYVGGQMISALYANNPSKVLPVEEAIAYILGIIPAFAYLHNNGFVYCDFKPDNFMLEGNDVKLVDVGGMRKINDPDGDIFGTRGYMAPEASQDPIAASDLYTIGRTLAVMIMDFKFQTTYEKSLPSPSEQPILAQHDSLYRFLLRACHVDSDQRFQTADEMQDQLYGVLREIVSISTVPHPQDSDIFTQDNVVDGDDFNAPCVNQLPALKMTVTDKAANEISAAMLLTDLTKRVEVLTDIYKKKGSKSPEAGLRLADALISAKKYTEARKMIDTLFGKDPFDWRLSWYLGKSFLVQNMPEDAVIEFGKVYFELPGELAPKLAIAYALESENKLDEAIAFYTRVAKVDPNNTSACIGLARCNHKKNNVAAITTALNSVPQTNILYTRSRIILANLLMAVKDVTEQVITDIASVIAEISADHAATNTLSAKYFEMVSGKLKAGTVKEQSQTKLLGHAFTRSAVASASEQFYRQAAKHATTVEERIRLVDCANNVRPFTLV